MSKPDLSSGSQGHICPSTGCLYLHVAHASQTYYVWDISHHQGLFHWMFWLYWFIFQFLVWTMFSLLFVTLYNPLLWTITTSLQSLPHPSLPWGFSFLHVPVVSYISAFTALTTPFNCQYYPLECKICDQRPIYFIFYYIISNYLFLAYLKSIILIEWKRTQVSHLWQGVSTTA